MVLWTETLARGWARADFVRLSLWPKTPRERGRSDNGNCFANGPPRRLSIRRQTSIHQIYFKVSEHFEIIWFAKMQSYIIYFLLKVRHTKELAYNWKKNRPNFRCWPYGVQFRGNAIINWPLIELIKF